eukprot:1159521-Pelagomonas_calceolata.AAC.17
MLVNPCQCGSMPVIAPAGAAGAGGPCKQTVEAAMATAVAAAIAVFHHWLGNAQAETERQRDKGWTGRNKHSIPIREKHPLAS